MSKRLSVKKYRVEYGQILQSLEKVRNELFKIHQWIKKYPYLDSSAVNNMYAKMANIEPRINNIKRIRKEIENANAFIWIFYDSLHETLKESLSKHFYNNNNIIEKQADII